MDDSDYLSVEITYGNMKINIAQNSQIYAEIRGLSEVENR